MNIAEVNEKLEETSEPLHRLRSATDVKSAKAAFSAFSYPAASVHSFIEELIPDFKVVKKGAAPTADRVWYLNEINTPLMKLFRKLRNVNTHVKTISYANRHTITLTGAVLVAECGVIKAQRSHPTLRTLLPDLYRDVRDELRASIERAQRSVRTLFSRLLTKPPQPPAPRWDAMFNPVEIQKHVKLKHNLEPDEVALCRDYSVVELCDQYLYALRALVNIAIARGLLRP
jgi:hypothetical protein